MKKQFKLTPTRLEQMQSELEYLKTVREKEVADLIKEARSFGDLSENSEYDEAKNEQGKLYSRIAEIEEILQNYVLISEEADSTDAVGHASKVRVLDIEENEEDTYTLVGSQEANPAMGLVSDESPFGRALMGKKVGEIAVVEAPEGKFQYKILEIIK
ncbi:MAG: transcription elongation factor GreA [Eubacteriales bacterium]|nr:transcription elongation factor GreA [Eubacteriales bacterium]MDY5014483.1 transcription elongation factor GreA [Eubacteriales bacterium]